jgi:hypothetical protein
VPIRFSIKASCDHYGILNALARPLTQVWCHGMGCVTQKGDRTSSQMVRYGVIEVGNDKLILVGSLYELANGVVPTIECGTKKCLLVGQSCICSFGQSNICGPIDETPLHCTHDELLATPNG